MPRTLDEQQRQLDMPATWSPRARRAFLGLARAIETHDSADDPDVVSVKREGLSLGDPGLPAALHVLTDLARQGWKISRPGRSSVAVIPPAAHEDPDDERARVKRQELVKRDEQLSIPSVRRFIADMEKPREFNGRFVSIFSLMRDGRELAEALSAVDPDDPKATAKLADVVQPYVQVIRSRDRCDRTGLRLVDIWRYFRHTWTNQYTSTPGRTMMILVRDRARDFHPVIGIAALASPIVQIRERDQWIGWEPDIFLSEVARKPRAEIARWLIERLETGLEQLHVQDLIEDGLYWPSLWANPTTSAIHKLVNEAERRRRDHHRFVRGSVLKSTSANTDWRERAESHLFRSKRCVALADLLSARMVLGPFLDDAPNATGLRKALDDSAARRAIARVIRRAKAESVGTVIADLSVCGAVAPYNALLGGKLVSMLAVSPTVVREYRERYRDHPSEIASGLAGRPIQRRSDLVFIGTTALYGSGLSQYSRVKIPKETLGGRGDVLFRRLGRSRSFGTSHLSADSVAALVTLAEQSSNGIRVNSIFGEGVNPKLRKARAGLDLLGWPSDELLQHRRQRVVYGVPLVTNLLPYLIGLHQKAQYVFPLSKTDDVQAITSLWLERWVQDRANSTKVLAQVAAHSTHRPVKHGARVVLPELPADTFTEDSP